jgi:cholesterol transport system auxiliary component
MILLRRGLVWVAMMGLSGCAGLVSPPNAFSTYDLGRLDAAPRTPNIVPASIDVRAPSWLGSPDMQYRLDYLTPAVRQAYSESRWAGHPAEMLQRLLNIAVIGGAAETSACRMRIEVDEFVQSFESPERSHGEIVARVVLLPQRGDAAVARQVFSIQKPAPSPDARGGVQAHRDAAAALAHALTAWLDALDGSTDPAVNVREECRR